MAYSILISKKLPKDSLQINNPVLIDNLETGLYKIEKDFEDGSKTQVIIQKNNE
ncbi:hypothetical protein [Patiriisocius sp. Uisw_017]|jgi:hypothetical protein|uniref:hypothetical protein n=1 Tax=Patiriisocius sp. Uisw_017 TaxID=3230968 RepID=UPI0039ECC949